MAALQYGCAVAFHRANDEPEAEFVVSIFMKMVRFYVSEFNITPADTFALVVFKRKADCERVCQGLSIGIEADSVRYFPGMTILGE